MKCCGCCGFQRLRSHQTSWNFQFWGVLVDSSSARINAETLRDWGFCRQPLVVLPPTIMAAAVASVLTDRLFWRHRDVLGQVFFRSFQTWIPQSYLGIRGSVWAKSKLIMLFSAWNRPSSKRRKGRTVESAAASQKLSSCCSGTTLLHRRLFICLLPPHFKGATHKNSAW